MGIPLKAAKVLTWRNWLRSSGLLLVATSAISLWGRALGSWDIAAVVPNGSPMAGNSAICQILLGVGFWLLAAGRRRAAEACGWVVMAFAVLIGSQHLHGVALGIDELFVRHTLPPPQPFPGRMAPNTAISFVLAGFTFALIARERLRIALVTLTSGLLLGLALLALLSYATGLRLVLAGGVSFGMSVATAVGMAIVAITGIVGLERKPAAARPARPLAVTAVMLVTSVGLFSFYLYQDQVEANVQENRSYEVVASLNYVELLLTRMQSAARGHLLSGDETEAAALADDGGRLRAELNQLDFLLADRAEQHHEAAALRALVREHRERIDALLAARRERGASAAAELARVEPDREVMRALRDQINRMAQMERRQQADNDRQVRRVGFETVKVIILGNVLAGVFTFLALYVSRRAEVARLDVERRLHRANMLQRAVLDGTVLSVVATEPNGLIREFNAGAERMLGYRRGEMIGRRTPEVFHVPGEIVARAVELTAQLGRPVEPGVEALVALARLGQADEREWTYVRRDGRRLPVLLSVTALRDAAGAIVGFLGIAADQTERKAAEAALRENELRYRTLVEQSGQMVYDLELATGRSRWFGDSAIRQITGLSEQEFQSVDLARWEEMIHPDDRPEAMQLFDAALSAGEPYVAEYRFRHRSGEYRYVEDQGAFLPGPDGQPARMIGRMYDISARKFAEAAMRENEERLARIFSAMAEGLVVQDPAGAIIVCNAAAQRILGLTEGEILGRTWTDPRWGQVRADGSPLPPEEHPAEVTQRTGGSRHGVEVGLARPDGARIWISFNCEPVKDPDGRVTLVVSTFADVTERRELLKTLAQARDQALAASRLKSEFLANVSHEIRTPMNGIIGMVNLLIEHRLDEEQRQMVRLVQQSADSLMTIINNLLDFAKIEAGRMRIEAHEFQLGPVINDVLALLEPRVQVKGLRLERDFDAAATVRLLGDSGRIRQVLLNLLGNAVKFTEQGHVRAVLRICRETSERMSFRVEVHDTGIGVSAEAGRMLFQPFTQADGTTTRRFGGTGLGLAISRQLVELMGGAIGFESEEAKGSVFWFGLDLPKSGAAARAKAAPAPGALRAGGRRLRLLLAEDNPTNQIVARQLLEKMGHEVEVAPDGAVALARLGQARFDAVLMDCQMPIVDGFDATRRIRSGEVKGTDPRLPVIALTAYAHAEDRKRCLEAGMDEYLTKPLRPQAMADALERCTSGAGPVTPIPPEPIRPVLDEGQLDQLRGLPGATRPQLLDELVDIIRQDTPAMLEAVRDLMKRREGEKLVTAAHRLAGSAANLGAGPFRDVALAVESAARAGEWDVVAERLPELEREWARLRLALGRVSSQST